MAEIARELPVSRPAVSQHLRVLSDAGLVVARPAGARRVYRADPEGLERLRAEVERFWSAALQSYKEHAERKARG